ncbi:MAG: metallophosphoesterase [Candidatus Nanohaloarchaea archaeon]
MDDLRIGVINDIHLNYGKQDVEDELLPPLRDAAKRFNRADVDIVAALGDFVQHEDGAADREHLGMAASVFDGVDADVYAVPGNHDVVNLRPGTVIDELGVANDEPYASVDVRGRRLVFLDTTHRSVDFHNVAGTVGEKQRAWLDEQLAASRDTFLFAHHPLHYRDLSGTALFPDIPELAIANDKEHVREIIEDAGTVQAVVNAHIHVYSRVAQDGVPHLTPPAFNRAIAEEMPVTGTTTVLTVTEDGMTVDTGDGTDEFTF